MLLTCCGSSGLRKLGVTIVQKVISAMKIAVAVQATGLPPKRRKNSGGPVEGRWKRTERRYPRGGRFAGRERRGAVVAL